MYADNNELLTIVINKIYKDIYKYLHLYIDKLVYWFNNNKLKLFFASNISYVIEIWGNSYKSNINIIMLLQKKIIRIINNKNLKFKSIIFNHMINYV